MIADIQKLKDRAKSSPVFMLYQTISITKGCKSKEKDTHGRILTLLSCVS